MYGSFTSVIRLIENLGYLRQEIFYCFQAFTIFGILRKIFLWIVGRNSLTWGNSGKSKSIIDVVAFHEFQQRKSLWPFRLSILLIVLIGGPFMLFQFVKIFLRFWGISSPKNKLLEDLWGESAENDDNKCRALYDFLGQNREELSFKKGDVLTIWDEPVEGWLQAELNDQRGLIPRNYVQPLNLQHKNQGGQQTTDVFPGTENE